MSPFTPETNHPHLLSLYSTIQTLYTTHPDTLPIANPTLSAWSPEHHIAHLALANELVLRNIRSLIQGRGVLIVQGGTPHPRALTLLADARLPRGEAQSPRMVRPPETLERDLVLQWLADGERELTSIDPATITATDLKIPHQLLGPLDAREWLRFGVVHTRHHLSIALEVLASTSRTTPLPTLPALAH